MKNYLILTPDGVGSTYLQRALTVYLNLAGLDYTNTHELLRGLKLDGDRLCQPNPNNILYGQTLDEISDMLYKNKSNLVSRLAQNHVTRRLKLQQEDYANFYKVFNKLYTEIVMCERDMFEYALSWCIRRCTNRTNVYSSTSVSNCTVKIQNIILT